MLYSIKLTEQIGVRPAGKPHIHMRPKGFQCTIDEREYDRINAWVDVLDIIDDKKTFHKVLEDPVPSKEIHMEPEKEPVKEPVKEPEKVVTKPAEGVTKKKKTTKK